MTRQMPTLRLAGVEIARLGRNEAVGLLLKRFKAESPTLLAFANTNLINQTRRVPGVAEALQRCVVLNDGIGLEIGARLVHGKGFIDNLNGTDFNRILLEKLPHGTKVYLYGCRPGILKKAAPRLEKACGVKVVGMQDGYAPVDSKALVKAINASKAQVVLVALGNPKQELWMAANQHALDATLLVGVGAFLDFTAGAFKRAPGWVQKMRCEWFYRLMQEPRRLVRRYTLDILAFLWTVWRGR